MSIGKFKCKVKEDKNIPKDMKHRVFFFFFLISVNIYLCKNTSLLFRVMETDRKKNISYPVVPSSRQHCD